MKISVVIPVFNAEKSIKQCLNSVINQTYKNWEIIAINDGSNDASYSILLDYMSQDRRFKVFTQDNKGPGHTRNRGISEVTGQYIVFLDADDYIDELYFEELVECVEKNNSDIVFVDVIQEEPNGKLIKHEVMSKYKNSSKDTIIRHQMTGKLPWGGVRKAVRTELINANNIMYSDDIVGEEAVFSFKALYNADTISFISNPYYHYINYPNSQSKKGSDNPWGKVCQKMKNYLHENKLHDEYQTTINSFGFTACIISMYRITKNYELKEALKQSKEALNSFRKNYSFSMDTDCLENRVICMLPLAKLRMSWAIVLAAKIKILYKK